MHRARPPRTLPPRGLCTCPEAHCLATQLNATRRSPEQDPRRGEVREVPHARPHQPQPLRAHRPRTAGSCPARMRGHSARPTEEEGGGRPGRNQALQREGGQGGGGAPGIASPPPPQRGLQSSFLLCPLSIPAREVSRRGTGPTASSQLPWQSGDSNPALPDLSLNYLSWMLCWQNQVTSSSRPVFYLTGWGNL